MAAKQGNKLNFKKYVFDKELQNKQVLQDKV